MKLKPWYNVVKPREDLREGKSQDASEFAVHLDRVRDGTGRPDYTNPEQFFVKTFLATNLLDLASQVVRRMSGETSHTSPVFNLATNFGGGKTHALTLLYHLALHGSDSHGWLGVSQIRSNAAVNEIPKGRVAVFVGTEFDSLAGRGGNGEPRRTTPWGQIAWQLASAAGFELVKEHDAKRIAPGGDVIRKLLPENEPCLILMDELMNYMSRSRREGLNDQFYDFLMNLSGAINPRSVLVVSVPASLDLE
jgi:predicted AAA+ superfamily ATPase